MRVIKLSKPGHDSLSGRAENYYSFARNPLPNQRLGKGGPL